MAGENPLNRNGRAYHKYRCDIVYSIWKHIAV
nr:MAG TPA: hypothetical protein [Caudoviricetes sp.]